MYLTINYSSDDINYAVEIKPNEEADIPSPLEAEFLRLVEKEFNHELFDIFKNMGDERRYWSFAPDGCDYTVEEEGKKKISRYIRYTLPRGYQGIGFISTEKLEEIIKGVMEKEGELLERAKNPDEAREKVVEKREKKPWYRFW